MGGSGTMDKEEFFNAIFELVDQFTDTVLAEEYTTFLADLQQVLVDARDEEGYIWDSEEEEELKRQAGILPAKGAKKGLKGALKGKRASKGSKDTAADPAQLAELARLQAKAREERRRMREEAVQLRAEHEASSARLQQVARREEFEAQQAERQKRVAEVANWCVAEWGEEEAAKLQSMTRTDRMALLQMVADAMPLPLAEAQAVVWLPFCSWRIWLTLADGGAFSFQRSQSLSLPLPVSDLFVDIWISELQQSCSRNSHA